MHDQIHPQSAPPQPLFKRVIDCWPYIFIAISVIGLGYIALTSIH